MASYKNYEVEHIDDLKQMIYRSLEKWPDKTAFLEKKNGVYEPFTYARYVSDFEGLGTELYSRGLCGKRIIVMGENGYNWSVAYMAVSCGLGVVVPVDKEIPAEEVANIANVCDASAILYSRTYESKVERIDKKMERVCFDDFEDVIAAGRDKIAAGEEGYLKLTIDPDALGALLFTSGTTGMSKGVMLSQRNICFDLMEMCQMIFIGVDDTFLSVLPVHHAYECTCGFLCQLYRGSVIAYCEGLRYITRNMKEFHPTIILCVPLLVETMYEKIWQNIRKKGMEKKVRTALKLSNAMRKVGVDMRKKLFAEIQESFGGALHLIITGGAAVDPKIMKCMRDFGILTVQGYGLTECAPLAAVNRDTFYNDSSAGLATPNAQLSIYNVGSDGTGEIRYKGANIMLGYFNAPELTAETVRDGWFYTGDLGYIDDDGFLHITGRKKNVIVTANGKNIFPEELETYLARSPFVKESVVVGIVNEKKKDYDIIAVVVPNREHFEEVYGKDKYGDEEIDKELKAATESVNETVQSYKRINYTIRRDEEFNKNTSRKILRAGVVDSIMPKYKELTDKD